MTAFERGGAVLSMALFAVALGAAGAAGEPLDAALSTCWSCHGAEGMSKDPTVPIIWGQRAAYLEKQLRDFRSGDRDSQIMSSMAESIGRDDLARAAALIAAKAWPKRAAAATLAPVAIEACKSCHGEGLMGGPSPEGEAPRLAGQFADYLDGEMSAFARGERANAKAMSATMSALGPEERTALANYLAGL